MNALPLYLYPTNLSAAQHEAKLATARASAQRINALACQPHAPRFLRFCACQASRAANFAEATACNAGQIEYLSIRGR